MFFCFRIVFFVSDIGRKAKTSLAPEKNIAPAPFKLNNGPLEYVYFFSCKTIESQVAITMNNKKFILIHHEMFGIR